MTMLQFTLCIMDVVKDLDILMTMFSITCWEFNKINVCICVWYDF